RPYCCACAAEIALSRPRHLFTNTESDIGTPGSERMDCAFMMSPARRVDVLTLEKRFALKLTRGPVRTTVAVGVLPLAIVADIVERVPSSTGAAKTVGTRPP